jgi:hypothetical protein
MIAVCLVAGCRSATPWGDDPVRPEVNISFNLEQNLIRLPSVEINHRSGRYFFGSAHQQSVLDPQFAATLGAPQHQLNLNARESLRLSARLHDLDGIGDAIIGADAWAQRSVTIDYRTGLLTYQKEGIYPAEMELFRFDGPPAIEIQVNGRTIRAVVDTALPDTLVLPRGGAAAGRSRATVAMAGATFTNIDLSLADVTEARLGNRLLSRFLISIDYGRQRIGLWRDPRIPIE